MILLDGVYSILESIYLNLELTEDKFRSTVIVNPTKLQFFGKLVWINSLEYDLNVLSELSKYNEIKSRVKIDNPGFPYRFIPYRSDRIRNIKLDVVGSIDQEMSRENLSDAVIYSVENKFVTKLPRDFKVSCTKDVTAYELYMSIINNSIINEQL